MAKLRVIVGASVSIVRLVGSLFTIWLTLGWKVRKTRKAFEKELIAQGMSQEDARRLSAHFKILKNEIMKAFRRSITTF